MSNEFPRVLYRGGSEVEVWGRSVDLLNVHDHDELEAALEGGWFKRPDGLNEEPKEGGGEFSLLDETAKVIIEHLPALTGDELAALKGAEERGKTRSTVLKAIDEAIGALPAPEGE